MNRCETEVGELLHATVAYQNNPKTVISFAEAVHMKQQLFVSTFTLFHETMLLHLQEEEEHWPPIVSRWGKEKVVECEHEIVGSELKKTGVEL